METEGVSGSQYGPGKAPGSKRTQFKVGERHGKALKAKGVEECQVTVPDADVISVASSNPYEDMVHVWNNQRGMDRTPGQKSARRLLDKKPDMFFRQMMDLERAAMSAAGQQSKNSTTSSSTEPQSTSPSSSGPPDEGLERVMELLGRAWEDVKQWKAQVSQVTQ